MPVIFITDALIFLLLIMTISFFYYARHHEHLRAPWRLVVRNPLAMACAVILLAYVIIGLLDSLHFHPRIKGLADDQITYSPEILSVLDITLIRLRNRAEKTYSAPFATHAYAKETIEQPNSGTIRVYPRLKFSGAHLENPVKEKAADLLFKTLIGLLYGIMISLLVLAIFIYCIGRSKKSSLKTTCKNLLYSRYDIPWRAILATIAMVILVATVAYYLSAYYHILGTDKVGEDIFYQSLKSIRTGLVIGTLTTLIMLPFAVIMGLMAGYFRGWVDDIIQYLYTTLNSIPGVLLIAATILILQVYMANHAEDFTSLEQRADLRLLFLCIILGITSWTSLCRLLRGEALKLREIEYIQVAQAFGVNHHVIMLRHLLPNVMHIVMITIVLDFSGLVLAEAVLSYINIGVDPSMYSWGNMINSARLEMAREPIVWWSLVAAFMFMFILVLVANLFADAVRDAFDPRIRSIG